MKKCMVRVLQKYNRASVLFKIKAFEVHSCLPIIGPLPPSAMESMIDIIAVEDASIQPTSNMKK